MSKGLKLLLILLGLAAVSWGVYECKYYYSYYADLKDRPWAYSRDENAKLLVGTWQGEFLDPDGVAKTIRLDIVEPVTDEERAQKAGRRTRKRKGLGSLTDKRRFDGFATVTGKRGREEYEVWGSVGKDDWHQISSGHFRVLNEQQELRKNFGLGQADGGQWQDDRLTLTLGFGYTTTTGSHASDSADPRYEKRVTINFLRIKS